MHRIHRTALAAATSLACLCPLAPAQQSSTPPLDVQSLITPSRDSDQALVSVYLGSDLITLDIERHSMRSRAARAVSAAPTSTYRGTISGESGSRVAASIRGESLRALVWRAGDPDPWWIAPSSELDSTFPDDTYSAVRMRDLPADHLAFDCRIETGEVDGAFEDRGDGNPQFSTGTYVAELLIEVDHEYFLFAGSVAAAEDHVEETINFSSAMYESTFGIRFEIATLKVWDDPADPFTASNPSAALSEFNSYVVGNYDPNDWDLAQIFSARNLGFGGPVGLAYCSRFCVPLSSTLRATSLVKSTTSFNTRVLVSTHEFGHSMGAGHCNGGTQCGSASSPDCGIMFSSTLGAPIGMRFGSLAIAAISSYPNLLNCVDPTGASGPPPTINSIVPLTVQALVAGSGTQTVDLFGSDLGDVHQVDVDGNILTLLELRVIDDQNVYVAPPTPAALGPVSVRALNGAGWSNAVSFSYVATDPPRVAAPPTSFFPVGIEIEAGGFPGTIFQILVSDDSATTQVGGFDVLANPIHVETGTLDSVGLGDYLYNPPGFNATYWIQLLTRDQDGALYASDPIEADYL